MTSRADIGQGGFDMQDVEGLLESYVVTTRIVASEPFVRRIHDRLAQEPPLTPWRRAWRSVRNLASTAFGREQVAAAVRLQALALLILGALALGMAVGGAGAVVVSLVREVTEAQPGPHRPNEVFPVATGAVSSSVPSAAPASTKGSSATKPKTGGSHRSGDAVSRHPTHVGSAAGGGQPTPSPRPTRSPRPTQAPPTATPSAGGGSPTPTIPASPSPTVAPTPTGTADPSPVPSSSPEQSPEASATAGSTAPPAATPSAEPVPATTPVPSIAPTVGPTAGPSPSPS